MLPCFWYKKTLQMYLARHEKFHTFQPVVLCMFPKLNIMDYKHFYLSLQEMTGTFFSQ